VALAPPPRTYVATEISSRTRASESESAKEVAIVPTEHPFSGFVFKIQANMNPKHRDSMAFLRICSGRFERDMVVKHHRLQKDVRLSRAYSLVAQDRSTTDYAYPGDVVGVINPGAFAIGDTISVEGSFNFKPMPSFPPEVIAQIRPLDVMRRKSFEKGMTQLSLEGAIQILRSFENPEGPPYVAAVGKLQFDVLQFRLEEEYTVKTQLDILPYRYSCYLSGGDPRAIRRPQSSFLALDARDRVVLLFTGEWEKTFTLEKNPDIQLIDFVN
jgi:peptide chain release factor 3